MTSYLTAREVQCYASVMVRGPSMYDDRTRTIDLDALRRIHLRDLRADYELRVCVNRWAWVYAIDGRGLWALASGMMRSEARHG